MHPFRQSLTLLQSITAHASGASQPNAMLIYTIKDMLCEGSSIPHAVRLCFESPQTEQKPDCRENPKQKRDITHQEVTAFTNPERPGDVTLAHVSTRPYRQLTGHRQSHDQTALNPATSIGLGVKRLYCRYPISTSVLDIYKTRHPSWIPQSGKT